MIIKIGLMMWLVRKPCKYATKESNQLAAQRRFACRPAALVARKTAGTAIGVLELLQREAHSHFSRLELGDISYQLVKTASATPTSPQHWHDCLNTLDIRKYHLIDLKAWSWFIFPALRPCRLAQRTTRMPTTISSSQQGVIRQ